MAYGSHTLGRSFSVSALDGIEVKVSENFKPVDRVGLPMRYRPSDPTAVLEAAQYDFNTETAFLNWLKNKKQNDAAKEAARKAQLEAESAAKAAAASIQQGHPSSTAASLSTSTTTNNCVSSPVMPGLSQDILTPTQFHSTGAVTTQSVPPKLDTQTSFDPRIFENSASDPFELTELQTINDMDELRAVFPHQPSQQQVSAEQSSQQGGAPTQLNSAQNHSVLTNNNNGIVNNVSPSEPDYQNIQKQPDYQNIGQNSQRQDVQNVQQTTAEASSGHDYQNVQIKTDTGQVSFKSNKPDRPSLPPRNQNQTGANGKLGPELMPNGLEDVPEGGADKRGTMNLKFSNRTPLPPISPGPSCENTNASITSGGSSQTAIADLPVVDSTGPSPRSRSPPPGYYASETPTPVGVTLPAYPGPAELPPSYPESLSRFTPLATSPSLRSRTLSDEERSRPDPVYDAMNTEDKNFVMTIMSMGFPKSRTSLAVKRLGKDDRPVVELLCAMDSLCSEGFAESRVEEALNLHDNDQQKAKEFLKLWKQFEELGFNGDDIKRELIIHGNNEEKVLDSLTA